MQPTQNTVTQPVTPARVLRDAARYLLGFGWHQGCLFDVDPDTVDPTDLPDPTPPACVLGAVLVAVYGTPERALRALADPGAHDPATCDLADAQVQGYGFAPTGLPAGVDPHAHDLAVTVLAGHLVCSYGVQPLTHLASGVSQAMAVVTDWNDQPERICPHVIAALYGAADEWDRLNPTPVADIRRQLVLAGGVR